MKLLAKCLPFLIDEMLEQTVTHHTHRQTDRHRHTDTDTHTDTHRHTHTHTQREALTHGL